MTAFRR